MDEIDISIANITKENESKTQTREIITETLEPRIEKPSILDNPTVLKISVIALIVAIGSSIYGFAVWGI